MSSKNIDSLVDDIHNLFSEEPHICSDDNVIALGYGISEIVRRRLSEVRTKGPGVLRMSNLDKPDRQLWYEVNIGNNEVLPPSAKIKFLFGDILEELLLFLAVEAGHNVSKRQEQVSVNGINGSIDSIIDDVLVDVKSASTQSFRSFEQKLTPGMFSYAYQVSGYVNGMKKNTGALLVIDKTLGHIALHKANKSELPDVESRIEHLKKIVVQSEPPSRCYADEEDGKSGNRKLSAGCSYCNHKDICWPGLRVFLYSNGPRYMTRVIKTPDVFEVTR